MPSSTQVNVQSRVTLQRRAEQLRVEILGHGDALRTLNRDLADARVSCRGEMNSKKRLLQYGIHKYIHIKACVSRLMI
jgi:hypothetical protein